MFCWDALDLPQTDTCMVRNFLLEIHTGESWAQLWLFEFLKQAVDWSPSEILELGMICKCTFQDNWSISLLFLKIPFVKLKYSAFSVAFFFFLSKTNKQTKLKKPFTWSLISCQMDYLFMRWFYKTNFLENAYFFPKLYGNMVVPNMAAPGEVGLHSAFPWAQLFALTVSSIVLYQFKDFGKSALALVIGSLMSLVSRFVLIEFSTSVSRLVSFTTLQRKSLVYVSNQHIDIKFIFAW